MHRLREDLAEAGKDVTLFDRLQDVRSLEFDLDMATNKAGREAAVGCCWKSSGQKSLSEMSSLRVQALRETIARLQAGQQSGGGGLKGQLSGTGGKENMRL